MEHQDKFQTVRQSETETSPGPGRFRNSSMIFENWRAKTVKINAKNTSLDY